MPKQKGQARAAKVRKREVKKQAARRHRKDQDSWQYDYPGPPKPKWGKGWVPGSYGQALWKPSNHVALPNLNPLPYVPEPLPGPLEQNGDPMPVPAEQPMPEEVDPFVVGPAPVGGGLPAVQAGPEPNIELVWDVAVPHEPEFPLGEPSLAQIPSGAPVVSVSTLMAEVKAIQADVLTGLDRPSERAASPWQNRDDGLIDTLRQMSEESAIGTFGEFMGRRLLGFVREVDFDHPAISEAVRAAFSSDGEFAQTLHQVLRFFSLSHAEGLNRVQGLLRGSFLKEQTFKEVRNDLYQPPARLLADPDRRFRCRSSKTVQDLTKRVREFVRDQSKLYNSGLDTFRPLARHSPIIGRMAEEGVKRIARFNSIGCTALSAAVKRGNERVAEMVANAYAGFVQINILDVAVILAKMHASTSRSESVPTIEREAFDAAPFWLESGVSMAVNDKGTAPSGGKRRVIEIEDEGGHKCLFAPDAFPLTFRAYPVPKPEEWPQSEHARAVLGKVEAHPDLGSKPYFDFYWLVVPGVQLDKDFFLHENLWVLRSGTEASLYVTEEEISQALDFQLIRSGAVHPALLGERDGKNYFLTIL